MTATTSRFQSTSVQAFSTATTAASAGLLTAPPHQLPAFSGPHQWVLSVRQDYRLSTIIERATYLVRRHGIKALVIDPYNRIEPEGDDRRSETLQISAMLDKLTRFAQTNDVLVILMAHPTKLYKDKEGIIDPPSLYDISGSAHFYNKADYGLVVHRNRQMKNVMIKVEKVKFRHLGESGKAFFAYNLVNGRYLSWEPNKTPAWDDSNYLSALRKKQAQNNWFL